MTAAHCHPTLRTFFTRVKNSSQVPFHIAWVSQQDRLSEARSGMPELARLLPYSPAPGAPSDDRRFPGRSNDDAVIGIEPAVS
jgi:hypothetical protein